MRKDEFFIALAWGIGTVLALAGWLYFAAFVIYPIVVGS